MEDSNTTTDAAGDAPEDEVNPSPEAAESPSSEAETPTEEALDPITALELEVSKWKDLALRSRADLDNFRKRMTAEKSESIRYANQSLFETLLPVLDNFHFGLDAARTATEPSGVLMGMEMVLKQFQDFLQNQNITAVPSEPGSAFDPNLHEAVSQEHDPEIEEGAIIKTVRSGYCMGDRLIRASNVVVSKGPEAAEA